MSLFLLMRHAKSSWKNPTWRDEERPLNQRGRRDAPRIGRWLRAQGCLPRRIFVSSACRARETATLLADAVGDAAAGQPERRTGRLPEPSGSLTAEVVPALYHASADELQTLLPTLWSTNECRLAIGHNPGLEELLAQWTGIPQRLPTAAVAVLEIDAAQLRAGRSPRLLQVWRPRELPDDFA